MQTCLQLVRTSYFRLAKPSNWKVPQDTHKPGIFKEKIRNIKLTVSGESVYKLF